MNILRITKSVNKYSFSYFRNTLKLKLSEPHHYSYTILESAALSNPELNNCSQEAHVPVEIKPKLIELETALRKDPLVFTDLANSNYTLRTIEEACKHNSHLASTLQTFGELTLLIEPKARQMRHPTVVPSNEFITSARLISKLVGVYNILQPAVRTPLLESIIVHFDSFDLQTKKLILANLKKVNTSKYSNVPNSLPEGLARLMPPLYNRLSKTPEASDLELMSLITQVLPTPVTHERTRGILKSINKTESKVSLPKQVESVLDEIELSISAKCQPDPKLIKQLTEITDPFWWIVHENELSRLLKAVSNTSKLTVDSLTYSELLRPILKHLISSGRPFKVIQTLAFLVENVFDPELVELILRQLENIPIKSLPNSQKAILHRCVHCLHKIYQIDFKLRKDLDELSEMCAVSNSNEINAALRSKTKSENLFTCLNQNENHHTDAPGFTNCHGGRANPYETFIVECLRHFLPSNYKVLVHPRFCNYEVDIAVVKESDIVFIEVHGMQYQSDKGLLPASKRLKRQLSDSYGIKTVYVDVSKQPFHSLVRLSGNPQEAKEVFEILEPSILTE